MNACDMRQIFHPLEKFCAEKRAKGKFCFIKTEKFFFCPEKRRGEMNNKRVNGHSNPLVRSPPHLYYYYFCWKKQEINLEVFQLRRHKFFLPRDSVAEKTKNRIAFLHLLDIVSPSPHRERKNILRNVFLHRHQEKCHCKCHRRPVPPDFLLFCYFF